MCAGAFARTRSFKMKSCAYGKLTSGSQAVVVIMAGGSGTRFWPMSRSDLPKQFLPLAGEGQSLIQASAQRLAELPKLVVTAANQFDLVREQLPQAAILAEPIPRNTATCLGYAAVKVLQDVGDVVMVCLPSDHIIKGEAQIRAAYEKAIAVAAQHNVLVTIGISPRSPETGYGYIESGAIDSQTGIHCVNRFVEKPNRTTAEAYLASGKFFWNSGMFIWRPSVLLAAIKQHLPALSLELDAIAQILETGADAQQLKEVFERIVPESIDVGVMERAQNVQMLKSQGFAWSDIGSWASWAEQIEQEADTQQIDAAGNIIFADALLEGCKNVAIVGKKRLIAAVGLENIVIVDTEDALLVCERGASQEVKKIVDELKRQGRTQLL